MDAVKLAQRWHEEEHQMHVDAGEDGESFGDCVVCEEMNPYYDDAHRDDL